MPGRGICRARRAVTLIPDQHCQEHYSHKNRHAESSGTGNRPAPTEEQHHADTRNVRGR
jgi:hypothetical protein